MTHNLRAVVLLSGVAAMTVAALAGLNDPGEVASDRAESRHAVAASSVTTSGGVVRGGSDVSTREVASPDIFTALADHRALATRTVGRSAERWSRLAVDVRRERLAAVADAARVRAAEIQAERDAVIAARKAAEEKARREAEAAAAEERAAERPRHAESPAASVVLPLDDYRLTARFGDCGSHWGNCHTGLDFAAPQGSAVKSIAAGRVVEAGDAGAYGNRIVVDHGDYTSSYSHLSAFVRTGGSVAAGEAIGRVGSTGNSTGPHCHVEIHVGGRAVDPYAFLTERGQRP